MAQGNGKKPFYKRIWVWVIVVLMVIGFSGSGANSDSNKSSKASSSTSSPSKVKKDKGSSSSVKKTESYDYSKVEYKMSMEQVITAVGKQPTKRDDYILFYGKDEFYFTDNKLIDATVKSVQSKIDKQIKAEQKTKKKQELAKAASYKAASSKAASESEAKESSERAASASIAHDPATYQTGITYDQIARTPDEYDMEKVQFTGRVLQVMEDKTETQIRLGVDGGYDNVILVLIDKSDLNGSRILEDDLVTVSGISSNTVSYESTLGGNITIPSMIGLIVDDQGPASDNYGY